MAEPLATKMKEALEGADLTIDDLAARTKVPRSTLRALNGEDVNALLPGRVYLSGHWLLAARELGIARDEATALFDETYPVEASGDPIVDLPRLSPAAALLAAGLSVVGIVAVVLAFIGG